LLEKEVCIWTHGHHTKFEDTVSHTHAHQNHQNREAIEQVLHRVHPVYANGCLFLFLSNQQNRLFLTVTDLVTASAEYVIGCSGNC
jgi:hypothetical protein